MANDPVFKKDAVYQKFNLKEIFGVDFSDKRELKEAIGQAIIERIIERTESGEFRPGAKPSAKADRYSESYAESVNFKAAGKSKNKVNMSLNGDMLGLMDIVDQTSNTITIGWDDETENAKAYNHNVGDTVPKRPFFGLSSSEITKLKQEFKPAIQEAVREIKKHGGDKEDMFSSLALKILDRIKGDDE